MKRRAEMRNERNVKEIWEEKKGQKEVGCRQRRQRRRRRRTGLAELAKKRC